MSRSQIAPRALEPGPSTSRQRSKCDDKSPHSKRFAPPRCALEDWLMEEGMPRLRCSGLKGKFLGRVAARFLALLAWPLVWGNLHVVRRMGFRV